MCRLRYRQHRWQETRGLLKVLLLLLVHNLLSSSSAADIQSLKKELGINQPHKNVCGRTMVSASQKIISTIAATNLHVVFEASSDACMIAALAQEAIAASVENETEWKHQLNELRYRTSSQHLLVGSFAWITTIMKTVKELYLSAKLCSSRTYWIWILTDLEVHSTMTNSTESLNLESFKDVLQLFSSTLVEGVKGVLLVMYNWTLQNEKESDTSPVLVSSVDAPGDGSWRLTISGVMTSKGLHLTRSLWPTPSFNLHGRLVRLSCAQKPIVFTFENINEGLQGSKGYAADLMRLIKERLNFSEVILPVEGFGSVMQDGSWNGMVGELSLLKADMSPLDFSPSYDRASVLDFGLTYSLDGVVILGEAPSLVSRPFLILIIFSPLVWGCMTVMVCCAGGVVTLLRTAEERLSRNDSRPLNCFTSVLKIFVYQSSRQWPRSDSGRVISCFVMVAALVVGSVYSGFITAFLAIPFWSVPINSADELACSSTVPVFRERTTMYNFIIEQNSGALGKLKEKMKTVESDVLNSWNFLSKVADGTYALLDTQSSAVGSAQQYEKQGKQCKFHMARQLVRLDLDAFAFARNSFLIHQFDLIMERLRYGGIITHLQNKYYNLPCQKTKSPSGQQAMSLNQIQAAFYVLGLGEALGSVTLVVELLLCWKTSGSHRKGV